MILPQVSDAHRVRQHELSHSHVLGRSAQDTGNVLSRLLLVRLFEGRASQERVRTLTRIWMTRDLHPAEGR